MIELLTSAEMAAADRCALALGVAGIDLMENAGRAVADCVSARAPVGTRVVVVAGPGNNGGDGFVAARILAERGFPVRLLLAGEERRLRGDAAEAARRWRGQTETAAPAELADAGILVDALFGAGLDRPVEGLPRDMIVAMNASPAPVIAADLPSGVSGSTGAVMGIAVEAAETVTFFRRKPGHLLLPGRLYCGRVHVADIGIPDAVLAEVRPRCFANAPPLWSTLFPVPRIGGHKYSRGHAIVVSGGPSSTGAGRLAARGALRVGAGLVTIASPRSALAINATASLAIMVRPVDGARDLAALLADRRLNALVIGPGRGVGEETRDLVLAALSGPRGVVLDADALTSFADHRARLFEAIATRAPAATILTPHEGEFPRLFSGLDGHFKSESKAERAGAAAEKSAAVVLLKGPDTVVAAPDGRLAIADNAPPWLASAGSGDVLAGMAAGLLAQGMPAFEAAVAAVWLHGEAANEAGPGLIAEDLPEAMPKIYRRLFAQLGRPA
jgi:hydroxyethylthiazole kinase-like uncharacterized protein yjeF